jgi:hypothetical protein
MPSILDRIQKYSIDIDRQFKCYVVRNENTSFCDEIEHLPYAVFLSILRFLSPTSIGIAKYSRCRF